MTAVRVDDDLSPGETGVAHGAADHESTGRVDVMFHTGRVIEALRHHRLDDLFHDIAFNLLVGHIRAVLRGDDDRIDPYGPPVFVLDRDLRFPIRPHPFENVFLAYFGEPLGQAVSQDDRHRHEFSGFVGGIPEHQPLITGSAGIHAHRDVTRLLVNRGENGTGVVVESPGGIAVADVFNDFADNVGDFNVGLRRDFSGHQCDACGEDRFAGDARILILSDNGIQDAVGDLVGNFIRMSFSH